MCTASPTDAKNSASAARTSASACSKRTSAQHLSKTRGRCARRSGSEPMERRARATSGARAITSQNATLAWKHEASSVLSDDTFELEVRPEQQGEEERRADMELLYRLRRDLKINK